MKATISEIMQQVGLYCNHKDCDGFSFQFINQFYCPICNHTLTPLFNNNSDLSVQEIINNYPSGISNGILKMLTASSYFKKLFFLADIFIDSLRISGGILISMYEQQAAQDDDLSELIEKIIEKETLGAWPDLIDKLHKYLVNVLPLHPWLHVYLPLLGKPLPGVKRKKLFSTEYQYTDEYGRLQKVKSEGTAMQLLVNFRNKYLGHGTVLTDMESKKIYEVYLPFLFDFLKDLSFLADLSIYTNTGTNYKGLYYGENPTSLKIIGIESFDSLSIQHHIHLSTLDKTNNGKFKCLNEACLLHKKDIRLQVAQPCPSCSQPLQIDEHEVIDQDQELILKSYPYLIAYPYKRTLLEQDPYIKIQLLKETFLNYLKYMGLIIASEYFNSNIRNKKLNTLFRELLFRPQFGYWNRFIREGIAILNENQHQWFMQELPVYYFNQETKKYLDDPAAPTPIGKMIDFRNKYLGHGMVPTDEICHQLWLTYSSVFKDLLIPMGFCKNYPILCFDHLQKWRLMGTEPQVIQHISSSELNNRVQLFNIDGHSISLVPFFVLPGEYFRRETSERSKLMVYEQNTGKRIIFFSPESVSDESSGNVIEHLHLLLHEKDKEDPSDTETLESKDLLSKIDFLNEETLKGLIKEKKIVEGVYQKREDAEIELRSWVGSIHSLFFIAAEAGSGKTNLLAEMSKHYSGVGISNILLRANRINTSDFWEYLQKRMNLSQDFDISASKAFASFSKENPLIILIDGGNEHPQPNSLLQSILNFLEKHRGGFIKIVLSWRVASPKDIPAIQNNQEDLIYSMDDKSMERKTLKNACYWLKPFHKKEVEGAWLFYTQKYPKQYKPLFSFEDLTYFNRSIADKLNNPLLLRIFLELFHGKPLPKKSSNINIWELYHHKSMQD